MLALPLLSLFLLLLALTTNSVLVNVTVDDAHSDPLTGNLVTYLPDGGAWKNGETCIGCSASADEDRMNDRTWHDGTYYPLNSNYPPTGPLNATFKFNGTAIYIFCAIALSVANPTGYSNMTFYIDKELVGRYERIPKPGVKGYDYNVSVYSNTSLTPGEHEIMLQNGQPGNVGNKSLTLFDYLVYSYDNGVPLPTSTTSSSAGRIAGGVVGAVCGFAIISLAIWFWRRKKSGAVSYNLPQPYEVTSAPQLFTWHAGRNSAPTSSNVYPDTAALHPSVGYGVRAENRDRTWAQQHSSHVSSSSTELLSSESLAALSSNKMREADAGPVTYHEMEERLPPGYAEIFANRGAPLSSIPRTAVYVIKNE